MPTPRFTVEHVLGAFDAFALSEMHEGGSLDLKTYQSSPVPTISFGPIVTRFGEGRWASAVLSQREHFLDIAPSHDVTVTVPVECKRNQFSWRPTVLGEWTHAECLCGCASGSTIREQYPQLVGRLLDASDADRLSTRWVMWSCSKRVSHSPLFGTADWLLAGKLYCGTCRSDEKFRSKHKPGTLMTSTAPSSKTEEGVVVALRRMLPDEQILTKQAVVLRAPGHRLHHGHRTAEPALLRT